MSLQVWLPLTKDLRNQGLSNCTIEEVTTAAFDNNGKLGKALSAGKIRIPASEVGNIFNNDAMSIAFWYNNNTTNTTGSHSICGFSGNSEGDSGAVRTWDFFNYSTPNNFHWSMSNLGGGSLANIFPANTWVHVCVTWSAPTLKIYMDGVLKYTGSGSSNYTFDKSYYISFGNTPQKMNDFRIYDHCLSPMEVKELAKGLVLHYPLNRGGWGQENLVWNTHWDNMPTSWSNWGSPPTREIVNINGKRWLHVKSSDRWQGYSQNQSNRSGVGEITAGEKLTLSCYAYSTTSLTNYPPIGIHWTDGSSIISQSWPQCNLTTTPQKFVTTLTVPNGVSAFNIMVGNGSGTVSGVYEIWVADVKLERGEKSTPWCPNSSDVLATTIGLNSTIEYDCSGFCNNGTRTGTLNWSSDTPRYSASTNFAAIGQVINNTSPITLTNAFTISWWGKINSWKKNWEGMFLLQNNTTLNAGLNTYDIMSAIHANTAGLISLTICQNGSSYAFDKYKWTYTIGEWAHYVCTYKQGIVTLYQNGVSVYSETIADNSSNNYYYRLGHRASNCDCQMSDFRIYATALSAEDVLELYHTAAHIDNLGNTWVYQYNEI